LLQLIELPGQTIVLGEVVRMLFADEIWQEGMRIDLDKFDPIGRLVGQSYCNTRDRFDLIRPK